jgi:Tfp pilus assembly protein PilZ
MSELRRHPRKAIKVEFRCRDEAGQGELVFDSSDVSVGGAFLVSDMLFEQGDTLRLSFSLNASAPQACEARVAWVRRFPSRGQDAGMGIEFVGLSEFDQRAIEAFLEP